MKAGTVDVGHAFRQRVSVRLPIPMGDSSRPTTGEDVDVVNRPDDDRPSDGSCRRWERHPAFSEPVFRGTG